MTISRREFAASLTGALGAAALGSGPSEFLPPADPCHLPAPVQALTNLADGIAPITDDERKQRISNAQRLMRELGIGAIVVEPAPA